MSVVTGVVQAAIVIAATAFKAISTVLAQVGAWLVAAGNAVKSAVQAAAKVLGQVLEFVTLLVRQMVQKLIGPLLAGLSESTSETRLSVQSAYPSALRQYQTMGSLDPSTIQGLVNVLAGKYIWILLGLSAAVVAIGIALSRSHQLVWQS